MYREIREIRNALAHIQTDLTQAMLAHSTKDVIEQLGNAQAAAVSAHDELESLLHSQASNSAGAFGEPKVEKRFMQVASYTLSEALDDAEKVPLGIDVDEMRLRLIAFKSRIDYADAFLQASLGTEGRG